MAKANERKVQSPLKVAIMHAATTAIVYPVAVVTVGLLIAELIAPIVLGEDTGKKFTELVFLLF